MVDSGIMKKLDAIHSDLAYIKKHMHDSDVLLTDEDLASLDAAENDLRKGKTVKL